MKRFAIFMVILALLGGSFAVPPAEASIVNDQVVEPLPVLFVHGYSDEGESWTKSPFYNYVQTLGSQVVSVDYGAHSKNDITSDRIDQIYTDAIRKLPSGKFDIVAHSMGGLLTRYYLLQHEDIRERVRRVIFIGTPNHGSPVAFLNRIQDMIDDPKDYWAEGKKDAEILEYKELYKEYASEVYRKYTGGQLKKKPYEQWLYENHPEVIERIEQLGVTEAGDGLTELGSTVLPGGEPYRYSAAFEQYAKLIAGRAYERDDLAFWYGQVWRHRTDDSVSDEREVLDRGLLDEGTFAKERMGSCSAWTLWLYCKKKEPNSAKNIVQDRLMAERFDLLYRTREDGRLVQKNVVSNLFLHRLWLYESLYRLQALEGNRYFPQYITIATVDDPGNLMGRKTVDGFIKNVSTWANEEHDAVVPLSSVKLTNWHKGKTAALDRNVQILPRMSLSSDVTVQRKSGPYIFHSDQMGALQVLKEEYDNPLTGENDASLLMDLHPEGTQSKRGKIVVVKPTDEALGLEFTLRIQSPSHTKVKVIPRNKEQTWDRMSDIVMRVGDYSGYEGAYKFKASENISDIVILAEHEVTVSYDAEDTLDGSGYPYYIQTLETKVVGNRMTHTFRVIDRSLDNSVNGLDIKDFKLALNDANVRNARLSLTSNRVKYDSSMMLALDYSGSMDGLPKFLSMASAEDFLLSLVGKTKAKAGVLGFTESVHVLSGLSDRYDLASKSVYTDLSGGTGLYDAVMAASNMLGREKGKKTVLLMTDGDDTGSSASMGQAVAAAQEKDVSLYIIGLGDVQFDVLQQMADETSGKMMYTYSPHELSELYNTITEEQDHIYQLEYDLPDLRETHTLTLAMTRDRSNEAEIVYGDLPLDELKSIWEKAKKLWNDVTEVYRR